MQNKIFQIKACHNATPEIHWREQLIGLLGSKPRRLSRWCELGMFGALTCLKKSGHTQLPDDVALRVYSEYGTIAATRLALEQARENLPMPFTFMQTQPGQLFNSLGTAFGWHGDGYSIAYDNRQHGELAMLCSFKQSALLAWVDDEIELISRWIWLEEATLNINNSEAIALENNKAIALETIALKWQVINSIFQTSAASRWLKIDARQGIFEAS